MRHVIWSVVVLGCSGAPFSADFEGAEVDAGGRAPADALELVPDAPADAQPDEERDAPADAQPSEPDAPLTTVDAGAGGAAPEDAAGAGGAGSSVGAGGGAATGGSGAGGTGGRQTGDPHCEDEPDGYLRCHYAELSVFGYFECRDGVRVPVHTCDPEQFCYDAHVTPEVVPAEGDAFCGGDCNPKTFEPRCVAGVREVCRLGELVADGACS